MLCYLSVKDGIVDPYIDGIFDVSSKVVLLSAHNVEVFHWCPVAFFEQVPLGVAWTFLQRF